ncbi:MAG: FAD-dependent oxidoreductase, partial [Kovacikia sp.]
MRELQADVLVVGGGTGGTAAALQSARRGAKTILVGEFPWLGGMLTSAGVAAPDGNELAAFQTGIWGAFLQELQKRQAGGLDHAWVSFFTYYPHIGAQIFADWVAALPNLEWITGQIPLEVLKQGNCVAGVRFADLIVHAQITLDGTELGDLLALAEVPHRWGWELQREWNEPSAPIAPLPWMQQYPIQAPTWVVIMQDFGEGAEAEAIPVPPNYEPERFTGAWEQHGPDKFLNYGRLPANRFMINWPLRGNDYGEGIQRLIESETNRQEFLQEARWHTQGFALFIQTQLGRRYGLAQDSFPSALNPQDPSAYALHPYYRESRRLKGLVTLREQDILPIPGGAVAPLPISVFAQGCISAENTCDGIAIGNYPNDHHYPSGDIALKPKSIRWGGRWTGTPFSIPYRCLVSETVDGLLVCEKNISVSHIANGATRLQPLVLGIGQAAGMAAALCVEQGCQPRNLQVRSLREALINDPIAPVAVIPLLNLPPKHPDWQYWQHY